MKLSNGLEDKFIGSFIGLSLGDALGAPYEGGLIERFLWKFDMKNKFQKMNKSDLYFAVIQACKKKELIAMMLIWKIVF